MQTVIVTLIIAVAAAFLISADNKLQCLWKMQFFLPRLRVMAKKCPKKNKIKKITKVFF